MTIPFEIMLRGSNRVFTDAVAHPVEPGAWTAADVSSILKHILVAIDRVQHPEKRDEPEVSLRGLSWIVQPTPTGAVIALEIHTAAAVAGPLGLAPQRLDDLIASALRAERPADVVH